MNLLIRAFTGAVLAMGLAAQAGATTTNLTADGLWHVFDVAPDTASSGGLEWIDYADGSALSFQFVNTAPALLTVVDGGFAGDVFTVTDGAVQLGQTSTAVNSYPVSLGLNFDAALADPGYSRGTFLLAPGSHTITGSRSTGLSTGPFEATVGAVRISPVPEPSEYATLLAGMTVLGFLARRRINK